MSFFLAPRAAEPRPYTVLRAANERAYRAAPPPVVQPRHPRPPDERYRLGQPPAWHELIRTKAVGDDRRLPGQHRNRCRAAQSAECAQWNYAPPAAGVWTCAAIHGSASLNARDANDQVWKLTRVCTEQLILTAVAAAHRSCAAPVSSSRHSSWPP